MSAQVISYFRPAPCSFWRWEENVTVIGGASGHTICYRDDLTNVLMEIAPNGLPSLANVLICLAACQGALNRQGRIEKSLDDLDQMFLPAHTTAPLSLVEYRRQAKALMNIIGALPAELRTGTRRIHLINELFGNSTPHVKSDRAIALIDDFSSGKWDNHVSEPYPPAGQDAPVTWVTDADIVILQKIVQSYSDTSQLAFKLKTGIIDLPMPADVDIPDEITESGKNFIDELMEDERTSQLAQLTQRLIAALNIPMHAANASDHSYGGISDISNRGNFDRLLLSELANDDMSLMARLVNNEALYLRREAPPVNFDRCRNILIDTTIKMWGVPRFFSISAALACAQNHYHMASVDTYALGHKGYEEIDLHSKEGVISTLQRLDPGLDSWQALISFLDEQDYQSNTENILIAGDDFFEAPSYFTYHDEIQKKLQFLIMVSRSGNMQFYEFVNGRRKLLNTSRFDMDEIFSQKVKPKKKAEASGQLPAFYSQYPRPLYYPTVNMKAGSRNIFKAVEGLVGVNEHHRLLYWRNSMKGARELHPCIEKGHYCFGAKDKHRAYMVVYSPYQDIFKLYHLDLLVESAIPVEVDMHIGKIKDVIYHEGAFYVATYNPGVVCLDAESGLRSTRMISDSDRAFYSSAYYAKYVRPAGAKKFVNPGYGVFQRLTQCTINGNNELTISGYSLVINRDKNFEMQAEDIRRRAMMAKMQRVDVSPVLARTHTVEIFKDESMPQVRFSRAEWKDGSQVMIDSNGLIHLRSSDSAIPEITFASILDKPNVCWASDHTVSGSAYFYDPADVLSSGPVMDTEVFYQTYIRAFIDNIIKRCASR